MKSRNKGGDRKEGEGVERIGRRQGRREVMRKRGERVKGLSFLCHMGEEKDYEGVTEGGRGERNVL